MGIIFHSIFPCELTGSEKKESYPAPSPGPDSRDQGTFNPILWFKGSLPCRDVITEEVKRIQGRDTVHPKAQGDRQPTTPPPPKPFQPRDGKRLFRLPSHRARCASAVLAVSRPQGTHGTASRLS